MGIPIMISLLFFFVIGVDIVLKLFEQNGFITYNRESADRSLILVYYLFGFLLLGGFLLHKIRDYLFPILFISTGKQIREYLKRKRIAYFVFVVIGLGIIINIISYFITNSV